MSMTFKEFEESQFDMHEQRPDPLTYSMLGLAGESGEVVDAYKKAMRDMHPDRLINGVAWKAGEHRDTILQEMGDVLWYLSKAAMLLGSSLEEVAQINITKLENRQINGKESE